MSKIIKTNLNEGQHIVGYKCDGCSVESHLPDLPFGWVDYNDAHYCIYCTYMCKKCKKNFYSDDIEGNDCCVECNRKFLEYFEKFYIMGNLIETVTKFLDKLGKEYIKQDIDAEVKSKGIAFCETLLKTRTECMKHINNK